MSTLNFIPMVTMDPICILYQIYFQAQIFRI